MRPSRWWEWLVTPARALWKMTATARLWWALTHPPAIHPLFRRVVVLPPYTDRRHFSWATLIIKLVLGLSLYSPLLLFVLMPVGMMALGLTYGLDCSFRVGGAIADALERGIFRLLSLAPPGPLPAAWTLGISALYRNHDFNRLWSIVRVTLQVGLALAALANAAVLIFLSPLFTRYPAPALPTIAGFLSFLAVLLAMYVEYIQSVIVGTLTGMLAAAISRSRLDAALWSFGGYLLVQVTTYGTTALLGFWALESALQPFETDSVLLLPVVSFLRLGLFFAVRELFIRLLWRWVGRQLDCPPGTAFMIG